MYRKLGYTILSFEGSVKTKKILQLFLWEY